MKRTWAEYIAATYGEQGMSPMQGEELDSYIFRVGLTVSEFMHEQFPLPALEPEPEKLPRVVTFDLGDGNKITLRLAAPDALLITAKTPVIGGRLCLHPQDFNSVALTIKSI